MCIQLDRTSQELAVVFAAGETSRPEPSSGMRLIPPFDLPLTPYTSSGRFIISLIQAMCITAPFQTSHGYGMPDTWNQTAKGMCGLHHEPCSVCV